MMRISLPLALENPRYAQRRLHAEREQAVAERPERREMHLGQAEALERGRAFDLPEPAGHAALGPRRARGRAEHEHRREEVGRERDERLEEERLRAEPRRGGVEQLGGLVLPAW
jgi:hypothetical protein